MRAEVAVAEREPTVIERMVTKYINTLNHQPEDCRDATLAMLAAVRELRIIADADPAGRSRESAWLDGLIDDHQRRAGGEGE